MNYDNLNTFFNKKYAIYCIMFLGIVTYIGLGISLIVIGNNPYTSQNIECPTFPNTSMLVAKKEIVSQWAWKYIYQSMNGYFKQYCPTTQHDVDIYLNKQLVARSDQKIISTVSMNYIYDCHGDIIYVMRTGNAMETIINQNKIITSFELRDKSDKEVLAYVEGESFFSDLITVSNIDGEYVAQLYRNRITTHEWVWEMTRIKEHSGADPIIMSIMSGKRSFQGDKTDICNSYFYEIFIIEMIISVIIILSVIIIFKDINCKDNRNYI